MRLNIPLPQITERLAYFLVYTASRYECHIGDILFAVIEIEIA